MDEYDEAIAKIDRQVGRLKMLRDAQTADSANYLRLQRQIDDLTDTLFRWEDATPTLRALDERAEASLEAAADAEKLFTFAARAWNRNATRTGLLGGFFSLMSLIWCPTAWLPVVGIALLLVAGGCVYCGILSRRAAENEFHEHGRDFTTAEGARKLLLPDAE